METTKQLSPEQKQTRLEMIKAAVARRQRMAQAIARSFPTVEETNNLPENF